MKKIVLIIALVIIIGIIIGCIVYNFTSNVENPTNQSQQLDTLNTNNETLLNSNIENTNTDNDNIVEVSQNRGDEGSMENERIKLTVNGNEVFVRLDDNVASPDELSTEDLPSGYTPEVGDFSYYAPWGNISVFYKDFRYSNSLYKLGTIESGTEILENMNGEFEVTIEKVN